MSKSDKTDDSRFLRAEALGPRAEQQDAAICLSSPEHGTALLVVADGVGGRGGGRLASQKVVVLARRWWDEREGIFPDPVEDLQRFCQTAHDQINEEGIRHGLSPRTTIVALYLAPTRAYWVHSGDSRLYRFREGQLIERTEDHSVLQILVKQGMVDETEMGTHPDQAMLLQSLGGEEYKPPTHGIAEITSRDGFLLCTDGFWERSKTEEMTELLFCARSQAPILLERAVRRAVKRNGPKGDNVTVSVALPAAEKGAKHRTRYVGLIILALLVVSAVLLLCISILMEKQAASISQGQHPAATAPAAPNSSAGPDRPKNDPGNQ